MRQISLPWLSVLNAGDDDLPTVNATDENGISICAESVFEVPGAFYLQFIQLVLPNVSVRCSSPAIRHIRFITRHVYPFVSEDNDFHY